jgi:hypothetical protein
MRWRKQVVQATLFLNATGVMVEAFKKHLFPPNGVPIGTNRQEVAAPTHAAVVAVQFVHEISVSFSDLQIFHLHYCQSTAGRGLYGTYLAAPFNSVDLAATPVGAEALNDNQRQVLTALLSQSDKQAWEASEVFRKAVQNPQN